MPDKFLTRIVIAAAVTLMLAFGAVIGISSMNPKMDEAKAITGAPSSQPTAQAVIVRDSQVESFPSSQPAVEVQPATMDQPLSNPVTVADLKSLSIAVHLHDAKLANVDKDQWKAALPKAEKLLQGACDCEEKNWLNHFVETANYALSGAKEYEESAKLTASLPKNDEEATTHQISSE